MQLVIDPAGDVRCVYDETLPLADFGRLTIARGSKVEPTDAGQWTADGRWPEQGAADERDGQAGDHEGSDCDPHPANDPGHPAPLLATP